MLEKLQKLVREYVGDDSIVLTGDMVILSELNLNSYELVKLVCEVEDAFDIEIPDRMITKIKTVQDLLDYIEG